MSTKTLRKRIALVAVSALGAGMLTLVNLPAASAASGLSVTAPAAAKASVAFKLDILGSSANGSPFSVGMAGTIAIAPGTLSQPSGGDLKEDDATIFTAASTGTYPYYSALTLETSTDTAGTYSFTLYADLDADGLFTSADPSQAVSFVVGGAATQLVASQSTVNANQGSRVTITYTALDASNRKTLLGDGDNTVEGTAAELINAANPVLLMNLASTGGTATGEALLYASGGPVDNTVRTASTVVASTGTDAAGQLELSAAPYASGTTYAYGEAGAYVATADSQVAAASYVPASGTYKVVVNTGTATGTITVKSKFGTTSALGVYTNTASATDLTITVSTVTTPVGSEILGLSATQLGTDATSTTLATTNSGALTTVQVAALKVDVAQPKVTFTLAKASSTSTYGIYVYRNNTGASAGGNNVTLTANTTNTIPYGELNEGFRRVTLVDGAASFDVTNLTPNAGEQYSVILVKSSAAPSASAANAYALVNVTYEAPTTNSANSVISPASAVRKYGESTAMTVKVRDQFDQPIKNRVISYTVSGRNPVTTAVQATTGADGNAVITLNDSAALTSTALSDTVTVDLYPLVAPSVYTETLIITYNSVGTVVSAVTLTDDDGATDTVIEYDADPSNGTGQVVLTATVLDSNGLGLPGVPVTINLPADVKLVATYAASGSTDSAGQFATRVYSTIKGTKSITASAGGKTSTATTMKYVQGSTADAIAKTARYLTLTSSESTSKSEGIVQMVATAKDVYGNTVAGVEIKLTENGAGRFLVQSGSNSSVTSFTDASGTVSVDVTSTAAESGDNTISAAFTGNYSNAGTSTDITGDGDYLSLANYIGTTSVAGLTAGNETASAKITFSGSASATAITNAEVLAAIVKLIASINKQITALQKLLTKKK